MAEDLGIMEDDDHGDQVKTCLHGPIDTVESGQIKWTRDSGG